MNSCYYICFLQFCLCNEGIFVFVSFVFGAILVLWLFDQYSCQEEQLCEVDSMVGDVSRVTLLWRFLLAKCGAI